MRTIVCLLLLHLSRGASVLHPLLCTCAIYLRTIRSSSKGGGEKHEVWWEG